MPYAQRKDLMISTVKKFRAFHQILQLFLVGVFVLAPTTILSAVNNFSNSNPSYGLNHLPPTGTGVNHLLTSFPEEFAGANVATLLRAEAFYDEGITGQSTITANIEGGHIWNGHETLEHVTQFWHDGSAWNDQGTTFEEQVDLFDRHATWSGGIIGGRSGGKSMGEWQPGIAPGTDLRSGAIASVWNGSAYTSSFNFTEQSLAGAYDNYFGSADVINSSWGMPSVSGTGPYILAIDGLADLRPSTTFVVSAGNDANPDNDPNTPPVTNTVTTPGSGYNSITVGALQSEGNVYDTVAGFSGRGPQDYSDRENSCSACRAAVDIVAPGTHITAAYYGGETGGNNPTLDGSPSGPAGGPAYYTPSLSGASFSSAIVAGAAALVDSASYNTPALASNPSSRDARVVKSVLLNSADKISGWNNGQVSHVNGLGGVQTDQSLDYDSGAGRLNIGQAYAQYVAAETRDVPGTVWGDQGPVGSVGWDFGIVEADTNNVYHLETMLNQGEDLTVTLTWFRHRVFFSETGDAFDIGQADLDVRVIDALTGDIISESTSDVNVVEHLYFEIPRTSFYQIEIAMLDNLFGNILSEEYGLAWSVAEVPEPNSFGLICLAVLLLLRRQKI